MRIGYPSDTGPQHRARCQIFLRPPETKPSPQSKHWHGVSLNGIDLTVFFLPLALHWPTKNAILMARVVPTGVL